MGNELQAIRKPLLYLGFECLVAARRIVAVKVPQVEWDLREERPTLILGQGCAKTGKANWVHVVVRPVARETMRSFAPHEGYFGCDGVSDLVLHSGVPRIH